MSKHFTLTIKLGNAAMLTGEDVADALREVAHDLYSGANGAGKVYDLNGNRVGEWAVGE